MKNWPSRLLFALGMVFILVLTGCSLSQPQQKPEQGAPQSKEAVRETEPDITVFMHETGQTRTMKIEDYLAGVVAGEMKNDWPVEALAAQAILARTFTVQAMQEHGGVFQQGAQASTDSKEFQAYDDDAINDRVKQAVIMTRGVMITYQGKPIHAWFHASAGGLTATAKEGLDYKGPEPPYIQSVASPDELAPADIQHWTAEFSQQQIIDALAKMGRQVAHIDTFEINKKGPSGRALTFMVNKNMEVPAPDFRVALDSNTLKSTLLDTATVAADTVSFSGKGFGHGVGLSQWGARQFAAAGQSPAEIIGHYFKDIVLEKRWN